MGENGIILGFTLLFSPPSLFAQLSPPPPSSPSLHRSWDRGTLLDSLYRDFLLLQTRSNNNNTEGTMQKSQAGLHSAHYIRKALLLYSPHTTRVCPWKEEQEGAGENLN